MYQVEQYSTTFDIVLYEGEQMEKSRSAIVQIRYGGLHCPYDVINVSISSTAIRTADGDNIKINGLRIMYEGTVYAYIGNIGEYVFIGNFKKTFDTPEEGLAAVMEYIKEIQV